MREEMSKQCPPAPIGSAVGPCPAIFQIQITILLGRHGIVNLSSTTAPSPHPAPSSTPTPTVFKVQTLNKCYGHNKNVHLTF